jgi:hypothetical protein
MPLTVARAAVNVWKCGSALVGERGLSIKNVTRPWFWRVLAGVATLLVAGSLARAETPAVGTVVRARVDVAGKQVVLPESDWLVAGHGFDQVVGLEDVPYGAIENVALFRLDDKLVTAFILAQHNVIAVEYGWQKFGPRRLAADEVLVLPSAGADG